MTDSNGELHLKQDRDTEHHLTFTRETGPMKGTYLTHHIIPTTGSTGEVLAEQALSALEDCDSHETVKAILVDNTATNTGNV